jgi:hypothetical protein
VQIWKQHSNYWNRSLELSKSQCSETRQGGRTHSLLALLYVFCIVTCSQGRCLECVRAVCVCGARNSSWQESGKSRWLGGAREQRLWQSSMQDGRAGQHTLPVLLSRVRRNGTDSFIMRSYVSGHLLDPVCWQAWEATGVKTVIRLRKQHLWSYQELRFCPTSCSL